MSVFWFVFIGRPSAASSIYLGFYKALPQPAGKMLWARSASASIFCRHDVRSVDERHGLAAGFDAGQRVQQRQLQRVELYSGILPGRTLGSETPAARRRHSHHHRLHPHLRLRCGGQRGRLRHHRPEPVDAHGHQLLPLLAGHFWPNSSPIR